MCGYFLSNSKLLSDSSLTFIKNSIDFRGPDYQSGLLEHQGWKIYHSRLSIIDPVGDTSNQPYFDNSGGVLLFNGEILNYQLLAKKHFNCEFNSDTALLSRLIIDEKLDLAELDGFFSFAYIDRSGDLKFLVRDTFGVKPLFYYRDEEGGLTISSEPKAIASIFGLSVSTDAINEYKVTRSPIFSGSYFKGVKSLPPGQCLIHGEYFNLEIELNCEKVNHFDESQLLDAIKTGLETRKVSDVPIGLCLSKGVDSNLIYNLANFDRLYSIGFKGDPDFEYLRSNGPDNLTLIEANHEQYAKDLEYLLNLRGEPLSVPNEVLLYQLAKKAKLDGVKVLLSGEGADEFFGGYDRIFKAFSELNEFKLELFLDLYCYQKPSLDSIVFRRFKTLFESVNLCPFEKVRWFFIKYHMPVLFRRLDFAMMAAGVEGREPLANRHTFNFAKHLIANCLMGDKLGKIPLRNLLSNYTSKEFSYMDKVGFPVNLKKVYPEEAYKTSYEIWFEKNLEVLDS